MVFALFLALERFDCHLDQAVLGLAVREVTYCSDSLLRVILGQRPRLFYAVACEDNLPCLQRRVSSGHGLWSSQRT